MSISYTSDVYSDSAKDRFTNEDTNIVSRFTPGYYVLFDKRFNMQDLYLQYIK